MTARRPRPAAAPGAPHRNEISLVGRFSGPESPRQLPSGDTLLAFRVVVERPRSGQARVSVDAIDCQALAAGVRRTVGRLQPGDLVEVRGALRRRFFRHPAGSASRYGVEAASVRRVRSGP